MMRRAAYGLGCLLLFSACARAPQSPTTPVPKNAGQVGYVRMDDLVKRHPLYGELARLDDDMLALQLKAVGQSVAASPEELQRATVALQKELDAASDRTRAELKRKQDEYTQRERAAIQAAVAAAGVASGPGGAGIEARMATTASAQAKDVADTAQRNFTSYRKALLDQDQQAFSGLQKSISDRAQRTYRAKVEFFQRQEGDYALSLASADASDRLSLRTKLSNLVLSDADREDTKKQLDALNQKETDALAAMKNRDQAALAVLQSRLREESSAELQRRAIDLRKNTTAKINQREAETRKDVISQLGRLPAQAPSGAAVPAGLPPDLRDKLVALHQKYQADFTKDANQTIADFQKTKQDLTRRFQALQGVDQSAQSGARKELDALQKQRSDLYDSMVAQIDREVKIIAAKRGIDVVFGEIVAPADGVDLTADAEKDIESLHE